MIISGIISWIKSDINHDDFILFNTSFFIASLPITIIAFAWSTLSQIQKRKSIKPESDISTTLDEKRFQLLNTKGRVTFQSSYDNIICFEANDNYCATYFLNKEKTIEKSLDRLSLKAVETMLTKDEINFERVHKSYIINPKFLVKIKGNSQAYKLDLEHFNDDIPVSRKYDIDLLR
jgi:DNA-binding LytR/AlgR family response regulator